MFLDLEVTYLLEDSLEYKVDSEGTVISLIEELGIAIDVPPGAVTDHHHDNEVTVRINACLGGPFELPEGYELVSPVFHVEPGAEFAEKPVDVSIVHFLNTDEDEEETICDLKFVSAPFDFDSRAGIKFSQLDGGTFIPGRRIGKISLQHFCYIGVAARQMASAAVSDHESSLATPRRERSPIAGKGTCIHNLSII